MRANARKAPPRKFVAGVIFSLFAMAIQALIPLVLAADIAKAADAPPICSVDHPVQGGEHHQHPGTNCPICAALAASAAIVVAIPPGLRLPDFTIAAPVVAVQADATDIAAPVAYRSRAPPRA